MLSQSSAGDEHNTLAVGEKVEVVRVLVSNSRSSAFSVLRDMRWVTMQTANATIAPGSIQSRKAIFTNLLLHTRCRRGVCLQNRLGIDVVIIVASSAARQRLTTILTHIKLN